MKTVTVTVTISGVTKAITVTFEGDVMPQELNQFIVDHVGGRPNDRKG
jgi:hypothetical protein